MNVTAVLYDGFETLDMFGPVEMLGSSGEFEVGFLPRGRGGDGQARRARPDGNVHASSGISAGTDMALGFDEIEPYYHNPFPDVIYFGIDL